MGLFQMIKMAVVNHAGLKALHAGSNIYINRHTEFDTFSVNKELMSHADNLIKNYYLNQADGDLTDEEAALIKLTVFFVHAEKWGNQHMQSLLADSIVKIKRKAGERIRPAISLQMASETGL